MSEIAGDAFFLSLLIKKILQGAQSRTLFGRGKHSTRTHPITLWLELSNIKISGI